MKAFRSHAASSIKLIALVILLLALGGALAHAVPNDFDSDGISDILTATSTSDDKFSWRVRESNGGRTREIGVFATSSDFVFVAPWATSTPVLTSVSFDGSGFNWTANGLGQFTLGNNGDTLIAGADFDGNARPDAAVVDYYDQRWHWNLVHNPFSEDAAEATLAFGGDREKPLYFTPNGEAHDWIAAIRRIGRDRFTLRCRSTESDETCRIRGAGKLAAARPVPQFLAVRQDDGHDLIVAVRRGTNANQVSIFEPSEQSSRDITLPVTGVAVVGEFIAEEPGEELAFKAQSHLYYFNPATNAAVEADTQSGDLIDESVMYAFRAATPSEPVPTPLPTPNPGSPADGGLASVCASYTPILVGELLIKSEISKHINPGDRRATGYTLVCGRQCPRNLNKADFFYANGAYAGSVGYYGRFAGNGQPRLYGAAGGAPQHFASQIAARARSIGNGKLYMQISTARSGAETICKEFSPSGRNGGI